MAFFKKLFEKFERIEEAKNRENNKEKDKGSAQTERKKRRQYF